MSATGAAAQSLGRPGGVNNTAYLFFVLALAFIIFITVKGDLPKWLGLFGLGGTPTGATTAAAASSPASSAIPNVLGGPGLSGGAPSYPALPALGQTSASSPLNTSTFGGTGSEPNTYTGPTYIDSTSGF